MAKKILFINQEISPYVPESEMSAMGRLAPQRVFEKGFEIRTFMPKWGNINERRGQLHEVIRLSGMNLMINETDHPLVIKVASMPAGRTQVYFIDNDDYFTKRLMGLDENNVPYEDNGERAVFFARGVLETVKKLRWIPDIIHCQGWMSHIIPIYVKTAYCDEPSFANTKVVTSIFGNQLEGVVCDDFRDCLSFRSATPELIAGYPDDFTYSELAKMAIEYSDAVVEATPDVSQDMVKFIAESGKPHLAYPGENFGQAYADFYETLLS